MTALEKRILSLQKQVEQLNSDMLTLLALTAREPKTTDESVQLRADDRFRIKASGDRTPSSVGINRYRQLRGGK